MKRRRFIQKTGSSLMLLPSFSSLGFGTFSDHQNRESYIYEFFKGWIRENDRILKIQLTTQVQDKGKRHDGGIPNPYKVSTPMGTAKFIERAASAYSEKESRYHESAELMTPMLNAVKFMLRVQHTDGTIDLLQTNFHSTPDTAFVVEPISLAYTLLKKNQNDSLNEVSEGLEQFLRNAGKALISGGIHTPNHRWVVCMALARLNVLFPNQAYIQRIDEWLAEQIDIDPDGQYTEKSTLAYTPLVNRCLITVARLLNRPALLDPVRRNLEMTLYYVHPNGEVVTETSGRQDKYTVGTMENYLYSYWYMGLKDKEQSFAAMCEMILENVPSQKMAKWLPFFQEDLFWKNPLPDPKPLPDNYVKEFPHSKLLRIRRKDIDATIVAGSNLFFTSQHRSAVLEGIRVHASFFGGKGQFVPEKIQQTDKGYLLKYSAKGPYYQPFSKDQISGDGNWENMPRKNRIQSEVQALSYTVEIVETNNGFELNFEISGTDYVPVAIEMGFRKGGTLSGVQTVSGIEDAYLLEGPKGIYQHKGDRIEFGPGKMEHTWTQLRGAPPKLNAMSVYITGATPFSYRLRISRA